MSTASNAQSPAEQNSSHNDDPQQAELFAASAAEGLLTDRKDPSLSEDLNQLTVSTEETPSADTKHSHQTSPSPSTRDSPADTTEQPEIVLSKEKLVEEALNCPCIASMREGPCGNSFLTAYTCFLKSDTEPQGMDCFDQFKGMQDCMADHPEAYNLDDDDDDGADPFAAQKSDSTPQHPASPINPNSDPTPQSTSSSL